jgi:hypothetical protein
MGLFGRMKEIFSGETPGTSSPTPSAADKVKKFKLSAADIKPIAVGFGGCIASNMILVDGHPVRFMYRTEPHNPLDSGWHFLSGLESGSYMDDARNHAVYDINTIANYDPSITPFLDAPAGSAFEKTPESDVFVEVEDWAPQD